MIFDSFRVGMMTDTIPGIQQGAEEKATGISFSVYIGAIHMWSVLGESYPVPAILPLVYLRDYPHHPSHPASLR